MSRRLWALPAAVLLPVIAVAPAVPAASDELRTRVDAILAATPLIDGHNDLPDKLHRLVGGHLDEFDLSTPGGGLGRKLHTDIPRLRAGRVGGQFWSVYVSAELSGCDAVQAVLEQIDLVKRLADRYPDALEVALGADDVERIHRAGKVASLIGMEGGNAIDDSLPVLRQLYAAGARYLTLTHSASLHWADSATDAPRSGGLSPFGREVVREMNRLGMLVDLSHTSPETMRDALEVSVAPVIYSHSSTRALCDHVRNVPDDVLRRLPDNGGVVMVTFVPSFISEEVRIWRETYEAEGDRLRTLHPGDAGREAVQTALDAWREAHPAPEATLAQVADHIEHVRRVAGIDHVGLGSDFDGITSEPEDLADVADFPTLLAELLRRGWSDADVAKLAGGNLLRVLHQAEQVAARLQHERPPSEALIDELDAPAAVAGENHSASGH